MSTPTLAGDSRRPLPAANAALAVLVRYRGLGCALALALPALQPLLHPGFGVTADAAVHIYRVVQLVAMMSDGVLFSRWAPDLVFGLGYPLFNFYPPLLYYVAGGLNLAGLDVELAMKVTIAAIVLLGSGGMYALARQWLGEAGSVLAAAAYTWSPFRLRELYFQGDFAQLLALGLAPVVLFALHRLLATGRFRHLLGATLAVAALLLSHNISAMLLAPLVVTYGLYLAVTLPFGWRSPALLAGALLAGGGLAAFFLLPALGEMGSVQVDALRSGDFDFARHFAPTLDLLQPSVPIDANAVNPYVPFNLGPAPLALALPALALLLRPRRRGIIALNLLAAAACVFLMLPASTPVWRAVPLLAFAEFPWRWLGPVALPLAFLAGAGAEALPRRLRAAYLLAGALALVVAAFPHLYPRQPFASFAGATVADVVRFEETSGAIGTTSAGEYLPRTVVQRPTSSPLVAAYATGAPVDRLDRASLPPGATAEAKAHGAAQRWQVDSPVAFTARVLTFYYPGWTAYVDGAPVPVGVTGPEGHITIALPPGRHELALRFEDTGLRRVANGISLATAVALAGLGALSLRARGRARPPGADSTSPPSDFSRRAALFLAALVLAVVVGKAAYVDPLTNWFRAATDLAAIPGLTQKLEVEFASGVSLIGYSLDKTVAAPGDTVTVVLFWRAAGPVKQTYASFVHLGDERNDKRAQKDSPLPAGVAMQNWLPHQFARDEHVLTLPPDIAPGRFQFRVGLYDPRTLERPLVKGDFHNFVLLKETLRVDAAPPAGSPRYRLGGVVELEGYRVATATVRPGEEVEVHLYWRALERMDRDYTVFVHLYDRAGRLWGAGDSQPLSGQVPTSTWVAGESVDDVHWVRLDPQAPPGEYTLAVGLYDLKTMQRLPAVDERGAPQADHAIRLAPPVQAKSP